MSKVFKKAVPAFLILITLSSGFPSLFTSRIAHAQIATVEVNPLIVGPTGIPGMSSALGVIAANTGVSTVTESAELSQTLFEWAQSFVLSTLKRRILDVMVDQVVTWIQGGGEPKFITDWETFLGDIGQGAVGEFVEKIGAGFLCEPFSLQVRIGLLPVQRFANNAPFSCTLDQIVENIEDFYEDFRNGGWIAYNAASELQNNYYGALLIAWDARNNYVADKLVAATNNALANKGFLGTKRCYDESTGAEVAEPDFNRANISGGVNPADQRLGSYRSYTVALGDGRTQNIRCEDTTPGGVVSAALEKAVGSDFDFIVNAQQLGDYAAAIVNALVNRLIMEGVNGLRGVHAGSGSSYQPSRPSGTIYGGYQSASNIPTDVRGAINSYTSDAQGGFAGARRQDVIAALQTALQSRTDIRTTLAPSLNLADGYAEIVNNTLACHQTVPSLQSGYIHDQIANIKLPNAQNYLDFVKPMFENNNKAIAELNSAIAELTALTDAQYNARANDFQTIYIQSNPSVISTLSSQARQLSRQVQTNLTDAVIEDAQRDLQYCISQGGTAPK